MRLHDPDWRVRRSSRTPVSRSLPQTSGQFPKGRVVVTTRLCYSHARLLPARASRVNYSRKEPRCAEKVDSAWLTRVHYALLALSNAMNAMNGRIPLALWPETLLLVLQRVTDSDANLPAGAQEAFLTHDPVCS